MANMRSVWKGHVRFSLIAIAIKLYTAIEASEQIKFNELHRGDCLGRVGRERRCKKCGLHVEDGGIVKGYEHEPDKYLLVDEDDLKGIQLSTEKIIDIVGFVDASQVSPLYYNEPYYLGADGTAAERPYALLRDTMLTKNKVAICKVTMRGREDLAVISPSGSGLSMQKLRYPYELRKVIDVPGIPTGIEAQAAELELAGTLVDQMATNFNMVDAHDRYHEAMKALLEAKKTGEPVTVSDETTAAPAGDIMAALKASLAASAKPKAKTDLKLVKKAKKTAATKLPKAA